MTRTVLVTFTSTILSCGGTGEEPYAADTTVIESTTTVAPTTVQSTLAPPDTLPAQPPEQLGKEQLRELVAPVALYPDVVLASLLPATTQPEQLHEAAEYIGDAARVEQVPEDRGWDGSVVGMLQFPDVVRWLDDNPAWTEQMGQAVTYQQADVLEAIQDFRRAARDVGNLTSNQYQTVRAEADQPIRIEPAQPDVVYVPSYDPEAATQPQPAERQGINPWIAFGGGAVVGALGAWALYSIFDDDDDDDDDYRRYGRRRIRRYDNYYYARGRRPRQVAWDAQPRHRFVRPERVQRPARLRHEAPAGQPRKKAAALRPPTSAQPRPGEVRQQQRQEKRQERQQDQQQQRKAQQERRQGQREQREQKQQQRQEHKQQQQQQRQEQRQQQQQQRQERRQEQRPQQRQQDQAEPRPRQQRQEQRQDRRQEQREQRQQQQLKRQERQEQRQGQRQQQQQQRQERRDDRQENRRKRRKPDAAEPGARNQPKPHAFAASRPS